MQGTRSVRTLPRRPGGSHVGLSCRPARRGRANFGDAAWGSEEWRGLGAARHLLHPVATLVPKGSQVVVDLSGAEPGPRAAKLRAKGWFPPKR